MKINIINRERHIKKTKKKQYQVVYSKRTDVEVNFFFFHVGGILPIPNTPEPMLATCATI